MDNGAAARFAGTHKGRHKVCLAGRILVSFILLQNNQINKIHYFIPRIYVGLQCVKHYMYTNA